MSGTMQARFCDEAKIIAESAVFSKAHFDFTSPAF